MSDRSMMRKLTVTPQAMYDTPHTNTTRLIQPHRPTHEPPISPTHTHVYFIGYATGTNSADSPRDSQ